MVAIGNNMKLLGQGLLILAAPLLLTVVKSNANTLLGADEIEERARWFEADSDVEISIPDDADLSFYLALAMRRNPAIRSSFHRWQATLEKSRYVGSLPDPTFSYTYFVENVETRVGPQEQRLGLRQAFPWFGTLGAKRDISIEAANADFRNLEAVRLRLFSEVKAAYYDYYYIEKDLQITRENMELLRFWESVARSRYEVGLRQHPDVIKAQVELGKLEDRLQTLEEMLEPAAARLRALLNIGDSIRLLPPRSVAVSEFELQPDSVISAVKQNNPDLQSLGHLIEKEKAGARFAEKLSLPGFTIGVEYIVTGKAMNPTIQESGKDPWMVGVSVSLPIWLGRNSARNAEARAQQRVAEYSYEDRENQLIAVTEKVLFDYSDALRKTRLYRDGLVPKAEQSLNANYSSYQAGETDFLYVLDAQRQLLDFQLTVEREKVRLAKTAAEIEMLTGNELERFKE